jgi:hypothetical protein
MAGEPKTLVSIEEAYVRRLIDATGISPIQARDLIDMLGCDLPSLLREARLLQKAAL